MNPITLLIDNFMIPFLQFSYTTIWANYAVGIILLTLLVKILLLPITQKQFVALKEMQKLQPKFQKIREKFKDNPQKMQQETMKLYKETGINPLGGCLPMIFQLPFLLAIFYTMKSASFNALIYAEGVFPGLSSFWLQDLSKPDTLFILPAFIGIATWAGQKLMPSSNNPQQKTMMMVMPIVLVVICLKMPAGVLLYWAVSQIFSTVQQSIIMKPELKGVQS